MTKRQFLLLAFITVCLLGFTGILAYTSLEKTKVEADVKREVIETQEENKLKRTKERWKFLPNLRKTK